MVLVHGIEHKERLFLIVGDEIDGLSGATLTSRGVDDMVKYWLGDDGFGPVLKSVVGP